MSRDTIFDPRFHANPYHARALLMQRLVNEARERKHADDVAYRHKFATQEFTRAADEMAMELQRPEWRAQIHLEAIYHQLEADNEPEANRLARQGLQEPYDSPEEAGAREAILALFPELLALPERAENPIVVAL